MLIITLLLSFRSNPEKMTKRVGEYRDEDIVLMLPPEKPTIHELGHFQVKKAH